jgi:arabinofuranosyltransferase
VVSSHLVDRRSPVTDRMALTALGLLTVVAVAFIPYGIAPEEDAAMLMRYAEHLAAGAGLVWNVGQAPVDGATDFLFTLTVAGVHAVGVDTTAAIRAVILVAWVATVLVVYLSARSVAGATPLVAGIAALPVVVGPARLYVAAGFGAPFFGLWTATTAALTLLVVQRPGSRRLSRLLGVSGLLLGLTRPEGVLLVLFLAVAVVVRLGARAAGAALLHGAILFVAIGGAYFAWRWWYFGHPLPNPFYKKGGGALHGDGLRVAVQALVLLTLPFTLLWIPALRSRTTRRAATAWAVPIVGFTAVWVLLSSETNFVLRFQYPLLVLVAIFWTSLFVAIPRPMDGTPRRWCTAAARWTEPRASLVLGAVVVLLAAAVAGTARYGSEDTTDERGTVGSLLAQFAGRGHTVATTEAGLIPLNSGWTALDTWGLNDQVIAHRGRLLAADLDAAAPLVLFVHQSGAPGGHADPREPTNDLWDVMTRTIDDWATGHGWHLVRSVADGPTRSWNIWVAPSGRDAATVAAVLACETYRGEPDVVPTVVPTGSCGAST